LVVLEGLPGAGKTTCFHRLIARHASGSVLFFGEANPSPWICCQSLQGARGSRYFRLLWEGRLAAMRKLLAAGHSLVLDRSFLSNLAYLHAVRSPAYAGTLDHYRRWGCLDRAPDLLCLFDLPTDRVLERKCRLEGKKLPQPWCRPEFVDRLRQFYCELLPPLLPRPAHVVSGALSPRAVQRRVQALADAVLPPRGRPQAVPREIKNALEAAARRWQLGSARSPALWQLGHPARFYRRHALWWRGERGVERIPWHRLGSMK
jgi:thymidylate kinase